MNYSAVERNKDYSEFVQLSAELGGNSNLVQGSGGNTSIKINGKMLVKASGKWLCDSLNDQIFVQLDLEHYLEKIRKDGVQYSPEVDPNQSLRPSIETCMHGLMPQKIILHVHSVSVIARSVLNDGALALENILMGMKWKWVPYHRPGSSLGESIREIFSESCPDILILANHGLVVGGESCQEARDLLLEVETRLFRKERFLQGNPDIEFLKKKALESDFHLPRHLRAHNVATDPLCSEIAKRGALYPDHVVFLGPSLCCMKPEESLAPVVSKYRDKYGANPKYILVEGKGILVNNEISSTGEEMLLCQTLVLERINAGEKLCFLEEFEVAGLLGWEAENYRQMMDKK